MLAVAGHPADARPTQQTYDVFAHLSVQADEQLSALNQLLDNEIPAFIALLEQRGVPSIMTR